MGLTRVLGGILFLALLHNPVQAPAATLPGSYSVALAWDSSPSTDVTGYSVHYGVASGNYTNIVVVGNVTANTVLGLSSGVTYFFALTAYDVSGLESIFSNEITYTVPGTVPGEPPTVQIRVDSNNQVILTVAGQVGRTYDIQATQDFTTWTVIGTETVGASGSLEFTDPNAASYANRLYRVQDTQP